jgi:hypothetical protein
VKNYERQVYENHLKTRELNSLVDLEFLLKRLLYYYELRVDSDKLVSVVLFLDVNVTDETFFLDFPVPIHHKKHWNFAHDTNPAASGFTKTSMAISNSEAVDSLHQASLLLTVAYCNSDESH